MEPGIGVPGNIKRRLENAQGQYMLQWGPGSESRDTASAIASARRCSSLQ